MASIPIRTSRALSVGGSVKRRRKRSRSERPGAVSITSRTRTGWEKFDDMRVKQGQRPC